MSLKVQSERSHRRNLLPIYIGKEGLARGKRDRNRCKRNASECDLVQFLSDRLDSVIYLKEKKRLPYIRTLIFLYVSPTLLFSRAVCDWESILFRISISVLTEYLSQYIALVSCDNIRVLNLLYKSMVKWPLVDALGVYARADLYFQ